MSAEARTSVAYIAARLSDGRSASSIYDYDRSRYVSITGTVTETNINVYDFDRSCYITGHGSRRRYSLYDYGTSSHIDLRLGRDGRFSGYDYGSGSHFNGTVQGRSVSLYDYGDGRYHKYTV